MSKVQEITITLTGGRKIDALVGAHVIHTDQPLNNGGTDTAPSPFELFLASIGTCAGIFVQGFCAARQIPFEEIRIVERPSLDDAGTLQSVDLELVLPASFPEKYRAAVLKVVEQCSVKRAIAAQPKFEVHSSMGINRAASASEVQKGAQPDFDSRAAAIRAQHCVRPASVAARGAPPPEPKPELLLRESRGTATPSA